MNPETLTALDRWLASGHLTKAQHAALVQWRDDGGGLRSQRRQPKPTERKDSNAEPDIMAAAARERHKQAIRDVERVHGQAVAKSVHRLALLDDGKQRVEHVQRGASVIWVHYRGGLSF